MFYSWRRCRGESVAKHGEGSIWGGGGRLSVSGVTMTPDISTTSHHCLVDLLKPSLISLFKLPNHVAPHAVLRDDCTQQFFLLFLLATYVVVSRSPTGDRDAPQVTAQLSKQQPHPNMSHWRLHGFPSSSFYTLRILCSFNRFGIKSARLQLVKAPLLRSQQQRRGRAMDALIKA